MLALIVFQAIAIFWIQAGARSSPEFAHWLGTMWGVGFTVVIQGGLWLFIALWFSRVQAIRDFLEPVGLKKATDFSGWCAAWLAIGIAFIDHYGVSKGLTESSRQPHPIGYDTIGLAWCFFALKTIVIVPFYEEAVTRGFLYRAFRDSYGVLLSISLILAVSAYFHWGIVSRSPFSLGCLALLWILICVVRERTGSLWNCLLCHAVYNAIGIYLWLPTVIVMLLLLPLVAYPILCKWRANVGSR